MSHTGAAIVAGAWAFAEVGAAVVTTRVLLAESSDLGVIVAAAIGGVTAVSVGVVQVWTQRRKANDEMASIKASIGLLSEAVTNHVEWEENSKYGEMEKRLAELEARGQSHDRRGWFR